MLGFQRRWAWFWGVLAILAATPAGASIVQGLTLDELAARSEQILVGDVVFQESHFKDGGRIVTQARIRVDETLKGSMDVNDEVIVETMGGTVGELGMRVEGAARFAVGQRVVVFVKRGEQFVYRPVGMAQGVMAVRKVEGRDMVYPNRRGILLMRRDANGQWVRSSGPLSKERGLREFKLDVRRAVAEGRRGR